MARASSCRHRNGAAIPAAVSVSCAYVFTFLRETRRRAGLVAERAGVKLLAWLNEATLFCEARQCCVVEAVMLAIVPSWVSFWRSQYKTPPALFLSDLDNPSVLDARQERPDQHDVCWAVAFLILSLATHILCR